MNPFHRTLTTFILSGFCLAGALAQDEIKVGEFASLTGGSASFGLSSHKGTALAFDELNAAGGVLGKKFKLITEDDQSVAGQPATIVRKLISQDKVIAVLGEVASSKSLEAAPICQQNKVPMISPASTNPKVTEVGDYIFRICFIDPFQGTVMSKFALGKGWKNVAILTDVLMFRLCGTRFSRWPLTNTCSTSFRPASMRSCRARMRIFSAPISALAMR